uniref:Coiled-coil domain containing 169 n=1 Tax=Gasterosteus aculeatus aculeatus TaxID=481459 RepID=A0AAQ4S5D0_GASAC
MAENSGNGRFDLSRLQAELEQERDTKDALEESVTDLRSTMVELQERLHSVDGEGNEWKTRYETQIELNGQLERQMSIIRERLEELRGNPVDRLASIRTYDDMPVETLRHRLKLLTEEKSDLQSQLMDCRGRIEQEGKLSSEAQRRQYSVQPQGTVESKPRRGRRTSRKAKADSKRGKEREEDGGGVFAKGGGGGGATAEQREQYNSYRESRLPTLKYDLKHNP